MTAEDEFSSRPMCMRGSKLHVDHILQAFSSKQNIYLAEAPGASGDTLVALNDQELKLLRAKGFLFEVFPNPHYKEQNHGVI